MRLFAILLLSLMTAQAQNIATKVLTPGTPIRISLSPALTTTLLFPGPLSGTFGLGLVSGNGNSSQSGGSVQVEHPEGSNVLVLHALSETARVLMTVLLESRLYVFDLAAGPEADVAVTLIKMEDSSQGVRQISAEEVKSARLKYDPELLVGFERRAREAALLRKLYPDLYHGYASRQADYISDSGTVKTTVTTIHRFSKEDAIVLEGTVQNETSRPLQFDGRAATVQVASEVHPIKLCDCLRPIPAGATVPIVVVIQGEIDGGRANLSIENEFRIMLPGDTGTVWSFKNGRPGGRFKVPMPEEKGPIPLTQTGRPEKEAQQ
jgi:hypothetical protein